MIMFKTKYKLFDAFGIPVYVNFSFALLLFFFLIDSGSLAFGLGMAISLALSVIAHELGHALAAGAFGYKTKDITLSLLGGCASLISLPKKASQELITAIMGPAVSFVLSGLAFLGYNLTTGYSIGRGLLYYTYVMNFWLGIFNLLPGFPMDGGRIFRSTLRAFFSKPKATFIAMWVGRAFAILLGLSGLSAIFSGGGWGFIRIMIAVMIWQEGYREYLLALVENDEDFSWKDLNIRVSPPPYDK